MGMAIEYDNTVSLTLILPSLNVAEYIGETLKSACNQTLKSMEILCIDAGSEDGTLEIIEENQKNDSRIQIIKSDKKSYGYQCNIGIEAAKGKYIAILETDDYVDLSMYSNLVEVAEREKADYVKADYDAFFTQDDGNYYSFARHNFRDRSMYDRVLNPSEHVAIGRDDWYLWQGIYSLEFIKKFNIRFNETSGAAYQDIGFLFWTGAYATRAVYLNDLYYHYRIDRDGASSNLGKGLKFSYAEFSSVIEKLKTTSIDNKPVRNLLYARMIKSFVSCYSRISEDQDAIAERKEIYDWFKQEISTALKNGDANKEIILNGHMDRLNALLISEEEYFKKYSLKEYEEFVGNKVKFAIFGCGDFGYKAFCRLKKNDKSVEAFFDNNSDLWGKTLNGVIIHNPEEARKISGDVSFIIANEAYYIEIKKQLLKLGIDENRIVVFQ